MSELNIVNLDDRCFSGILKYLDTWDQLQFARVCVRFQQAFHKYAKQYYREFRIEKTNIRGKLTMLPIIAKDIKKLYVDLKYLKGLVASQSKWNKRLIIKGSNLSRSVVLEKVLRELKHSRNLKSLEICYSHFLPFETWQIKHLCKLKHLEELKLGIKISGDDLKDCCKSNSRLRIIHLIKYQQSFDYIEQHITNLDELRHYDFSFYDNIEDFNLSS